MNRRSALLIGLSFILWHFPPVESGTPLSPFKIALLLHFGVHFSQLHPLGLMRVVHFKLSCAAVSGEPSVPLFCMFYKLIFDGDWFPFAKRQNNVSKPCYTFMSTSTYPKEWKSGFIFVSAAMIPESPPPKDAEAAIKDNIPILSTDEILTLWRLLQGDSKDVKFVVGDEVDPGLNRSTGIQVTEGSIQAGGSIAVEGGDGTSSDGEESSPDPPPVKQSSHDNDEELEIRLVRKRKAVSPKPAPATRDIRKRLRSASGQKPPPSTKAASELPLAGVKGSLSKHLRSSSLVSAPLLVTLFSLLPVAIYSFWEVFDIRFFLLSE
ncbi:hypothetical protein HanOQP8_Chr05g0193001 [Helianthus annuus]|nr:hypothetical protein HanOQP8_Chr05g0193001 [Helianthus annuus]